MSQTPDENAPIFKSIIGALTSRYRERFSLLRSPNWDELQAALKESPNDLLFAGHGAYDSSKPAASWLSIGSPEGLSFERLFTEIDLPRLRSVTMGACESGLDRAELSSEYIGLANVFLSAGVHYVVASLWTVYALATAQLLGRLFQLLSSSAKTLLAALNCAQREVMAIIRDELRSWVCERLPTMDAAQIDRLDSLPFSHAYFWAGFYESGDL